jgi:acetolactate synthase-1/2/3 large subunit
MFAAQHLISLKPKTFLTSGGYGTMGFALPTAIGAHYANPDDTIITIDGDGSLLMNLGELFTVSKYQLPVKILLLNNHGDCMVRNIQDLIYGGAHVGTKKITDISFANVAQEMGFAYSRRIDSRDELKQGLEDFISAEGPSFLEVVTDVDEMLYPRIPSGMGYKDMILGPHME